MIATRYGTLLILTLICVCVATSMQAAWLNNMPAPVTQPDGSKLDLLASGDEYHNWLHDSNNFTIIRDKTTGFFCYAQKSGEELIASTAIVGRDLPSSRGLTPGINISPETYKQLRATRFYMPESRDAPTTGTINNIVIYIRFSDESEFGENISLYDGWFNTSASSQKNYYLEASYNQLTVNTSFYPSPANNLVVSWQSGNPRAYYQPYDASTNPTGYNGDTEQRTREFSLLQSATNAVSSQIPSSLNIDSDNDGRVDNVVYIVRGAAGAWSSLLWPHRWSLYDRFVYINGKRVYDFNFQLQTFLASRAVGVICHEFFHTLGAPDLYHYTSNGISPAGSWDIMQSDQNPPQHMTAFMKWKYGDWISSIPTITTDQAYTLNPLTSSTGNAYRINSNNANQYYIVEFRKKTGTFESSIPGSGMLVYRIDTSAGNGNADGPPDELYIYRPGGTTTVDGTVSSANFSTETGRTRINGSTNPSPFLQDGSAGNLSLYGIGSSAGSTLTFNKGTPPIITIDFSTNPYVESFDATLFPPDGWDNQAITGTKLFERVTTGGSPTCSPANGSAMLRYNSYSAASGNSAYLVSPRINCSNISDYNYSITFSMYRDTGYTTNADRMEVYLNSTQNLSGTPTLLGTINRYTGFAPIVSSTGWYQYSYSLNVPATGYYYVVLKAISAYGNNMFMDYLRVYKNTNPPLAAINPNPVTGSSDIAISQALSWASGGGIISGYKLYLGTNNPPSNLVNGSNLGNVTSYTHPGGWNYTTPYYWKIVPTSAGGDAVGATIWSFSTLADPRITAVPHQENFDTVSSPALPSGWSSIVSSTSTSAYARSYASTSYALSAPNCIQLSNSSDAAADLRVVSPEIMLPLSSLRISFSARGSLAYPLFIGTMSSPTGSFNPWAELSLTASHANYSVSFASYTGSDRYLAIKHGLGGTYRSIYLDNLLFEALRTNDLMSTSLNGMAYCTLGQELSFQVGIKNYGSAAQSSYQILLLDANTQALLSSLDCNSLLAPEQTATHSISWIPGEAGQRSVYASVYFASDSYASNNSTRLLELNIYPQNNYIPLAGDPQSSSTANSLPLNFYWKNSLSETIYLADELIIANGNIEGLIYKTNFVEELSQKPVKIWLKNTSATELTTSWLDFDGYSLVFEGLLDFAPDTNYLLIPFSMPFAYTGGNLAIRANRPMDTAYFSTNNHFFNSLDSMCPNRSRYLQSDSVLYDPAAPSAAGTLSSLIPLTAFVCTNASLNSPQLLINRSGDSVQLCWNAVRGAVSYKIFASDDPFNWPDSSEATVSGTSFNGSPSGKRFYKVVASTVANE